MGVGGGHSEVETALELSDNAQKRDLALAYLLTSIDSP